MKFSNCLKGFIIKKKWVILFIAISAILLILRSILNKNGIDAFNTMIDMSIGSSFTAFIYLLIYYKNANDLSITRKTTACPYFKICNKRTLTPDVINNADTINLMVPIRTIKIDTSMHNIGDEYELDDSLVKEELPFKDCTTEIMIKSYNHADFIIDSLAFIAKKDDEITTKHPKKITAYRICNPEYDYYVEKGQYYNIKINMHFANITEEQGKGIIGIVIIDTTPECNKYFIPIVDSTTQYTIGKRFEISDISNLHFGKAPKNILHFFTHSSWKDN